MSHSSFPIEWENTNLGQVAELITKGTTPTTYGHKFTTDGVPFIKIENIDEYGVNITTVNQYIDEETHELLGRSKFQVGDVLFTIAGTIGKTALIEKQHVPANTNQAVAIIRGTASTFNPNFLRQQLRAASKEIARANARGGAMNNVSLGDLKDIKVCVPPLAEQKQIAAKLDELLAQVDTIKTRLDAIPHILKRFRQSVLAAAVSGKLTEEWRIENSTLNSTAKNVITSIQHYKAKWASTTYSHNEASRVKRRTENFVLDDCNRGGLPETWMFCSLEDVSLMVVDCHNKTAPYVDSGIPLVRTTNIRDGRFAWSDLRYVNDETYAYWSRRCPPEPGDIVFTREAPMGEAAIIPENTKICLGQRTMLIRPVEELLSAKYLLLVLLDPVFKKRSEEIAVGTGVKHYRVGDVSELQVPVPPLEEQTEIVRRVEQLFAYADQIEQRVKDAQARVNHLTQSILAKAFRGELTADWRAQNPDLISGDNSAAALLTRIRAEREAVAGKPKTRRKKA